MAVITGSASELQSFLSFIKAISISIESIASFYIIKFLKLGAAITSVIGAVVSWLPFYLKKPQLSLNISIKVISVPYLALRIKNNGDKEAKNITINVVKKFYNFNSGKLLSQGEQPKRISGDLAPKEETDVLICISDADTEYPYNHLVVKLKYQDSIIRKWCRKHTRESVWFFSIEHGKRISDELNRIDNVRHIPADLWE